MTDRAFFATKVFTQASTPTGTQQPATRMSSVETPAPMAARSAKAGSARTARSRADQAVSGLKEVSGKKTLNFCTLRSMSRSALRIFFISAAHDKASDRRAIMKISSQMPTTLQSRCRSQTLPIDGCTVPAKRIVLQPSPCCPPLQQGR